MKIVYIAGPYMGATHDYRSYFEIERNITVAAEAAATLVTHGYGFFCPHLHSAHFEVIVPRAPVEFWRELDCAFLEVCDAMLMVGEWRESKGACHEKRVAEMRGLPVFESLLDLAQELQP